MAHKQGPDGSRILTALEVDAAAIGFRKVHDVALNTTRWVVNCQGCGTESGARLAGQHRAGGHGQEHEAHRLGA
jgi:hypothetical protein